MVRLVYRSSSSGKIDLPALQEILQASRKNNRRLGVTGLLLADSNGFLQVLEGEVHAVNGLFQKVSRDRRHAEVVLVSYEPIEARSFSRWNMRGVGLFTYNEKLREGLVEKYGLRQCHSPFELPPARALALLLEVALTVPEEGADDEGEAR